MREMSDERSGERNGEMRHEIGHLYANRMSIRNTLFIHRLFATTTHLTLNNFEQRVPTTESAVFLIGEISATSEW